MPEIVPVSGIRFSWFARQPRANYHVCAGMKKDADILDSAQRAAEKARAREEDQRALASGEKSAEQLRLENGAFAFPPSRVRLDLRGKLS
jgi:hypothetical protein